MSSARLIAIVVVLAVTLPALRAGGQGRFQVEPTRIDLSSRAPSDAITVTNRGTTVLRLQATAFRWADDANGAMQLTPAPELAVRPSLFEVQPGKMRAIRVGTTATAGAVEQSFRVFIEELPDRSAAPSTSGIRVLTRIGVPVFIAPHANRVAIDLRAVNEPGRVAVVVHNTGSLHVKLASVKLRAADGTWERSAAGWYVLPGYERRFAIQPGPPCGKDEQWIVEAISDDGDRWKSPPSRCEP